MADNIFKGILKGKSVIAGIGNIMRADDGFGPALIEKLRAYQSGRFLFVDAGSAPENYTRTIANFSPQTILLVDAVHLNKPAGAYEVLKEEDILKTGFTTHDMSSRMFIEYLHEQTKANIYLLGVQPQTLVFGQEMSLVMEQALNLLSLLLIEVIQKERLHA